MLNAVVRSFRSACLAAVGLCGSAMATDHFVAPWGDDSKDGLSWETAMKSPELAVDKWRNEQGNTTSSHTLFLANGTYKLTKPIECSSSTDMSHLLICSESGDPKDVVIDGQGACSGIRMGGYNNEIYGLTVTNCLARDMEGGGIFFRTTWGKLHDCIVRDCHIELTAASANGGGIFAMWSTVANVTVENCSIYNAEGAGARSCRGGGISGYYTTISNSAVRNCSIRLNEGPCYPKGGGISDSTGTDDKPSTVLGYPRTLIVDTVVSGCSISMPYDNGGEGAAIAMSVSKTDWEEDGVVHQYQGEIRNCLVTNNVSHYRGAVYLNQADLVGSTICCNTDANGKANKQASAVALNARSHIRNCRIRGNVGTLAAGDYYNGSTPAVWFEGSDGSMTDSVIEENRGAQNVAAVLGKNSLISNCVFRANVQTSSARFGLMRLSGQDEGSVTEVVDCTFEDNDLSSCTWGSVLLVLNNKTHEWTARLRNCLIANNRFGKSGVISVYNNAADSKLFSLARLETENCTIVSNTMVSGSIVHGYHEGTSDPAVKAWSHFSPSNVYVKGCAILWNPGADETIDSLTRKYTDHVTSSLLTERVEFSDQLGNRVYDSSKPLFADVEHGDFRPAAGSQLCDGVPYAPWMGDGRRRSNSTFDLGRGYEVQPLGDYGVKVVRLDAKPRFYGEAADIGCCEFYMPPGMMLLFR